MEIECPNCKSLAYVWEGSPDWVNCPSCKLYNKKHEASQTDSSMARSCFYDDSSRGGRKGSGRDAVGKSKEPRTRGTERHRDVRDGWRCETQITQKTEWARKEHKKNFRKRSGIGYTQAQFDEAWERSKKSGSNLIPKGG